MSEFSGEQELSFEQDGNGCFGCSSSNRQGLQLRFFRSGRSVISRYTIPDHFHGAPNVAHGGIVATLLDEVSCAAARHTEGEYVVTGELSVRYEKPCPVGVPLLITAEVSERCPRYWIINGKVEKDGDLLARSEGRFFPAEVRSTAQDLGARGWDRKQ